MVVISLTILPVDLIKTMRSILLIKDLGHCAFGQAKASAGEAGRARTEERMRRGAVAAKRREDGIRDARLVRWKAFPPLLYVQAGHEHTVPARFTLPQRISRS